MPPPRLFPPSRVVAQASRAFAESRYSHSLWSNVSSQIWRPSRLSTSLSSKIRTAHTSASLHFPRRLIRSSNRHASLQFSPAFRTTRTPFRASRRWNSTNPPPSKPLTFSERMRKLSREYGWSALGVYLFLSALDFPFCFAAVRLLGVERVGHYEHVVVESVKNFVEPIWGAGKNKSAESLDAESMAMEGGIESTAMDHGIMNFEGSSTGKGASIWTQLALAYAVHKSLIFFRVPLTAAVTPKVVKTLRRWGWNIGKRKPKTG